jgi:hypothetical protein
MRSAAVGIGAITLAAGIVAGVWVCLCDRDASSVDAGVERSSAALDSLSLAPPSARDEPPADVHDLQQREIASSVNAGSSANAKDQLADEKTHATIHLFGFVRGIPPDSNDDSSLDRARAITEFANQQSRSGLRVRANGDATVTIDTHGYPLGNVELIDESGHSRQASIDSSGRYSITGVRAGKHTLSVHAIRCRPLDTDIDLDPGEQEHEFDLVLQPKDRIDVSVIARRKASDVPSADDGKSSSEPSPFPLNSELIPIDVVVTREPLGKFIDVAHVVPASSWPFWLSLHAAAGEGSNARLGRTKQTLWPDDPLPLYVSATTGGVVIASKRAEIGTDALTFEIDADEIETAAARVHLRIVERDGSPAPSDCKVELRSALTRTHAYGSKDASPVSPDANGNVSMSMLAGGPMVLTILADGHETFERSVNVIPGADNDLGTFEIDRWCSITGRTLDEEGRPISVLVNAFPLDRFDSTRVELSQRYFKSNEEGELNIPSLGRGRYVVRIVDDNWGSAPIAADTTNGPVHDLDVRLKRKVDVVLRFAHRLTARSLLRVESSDRIPVLERDASGARADLRLVPGLYVLRVTRGDEEILRSALFVDTKASEVVIPE